jgi:cytochrome c oxidase assembly factor CtaG/ferredoxin
MENNQTASVLASWTFEWIPALGLSLAAFIYWNGWRKVRRLAPERFPEWRLLSFFAGLLAIYVALASPLDAFGAWLLSVHMVQHLLLTMVAPTLILQGAPFLPMLSGLPRGLVSSGLGPFLNDPYLKKIGAVLIHPFFAGPLFMLSNLLWHVPAFYELALSSSFWHKAEHVCFLATAMLFWWPVVQPWPSRSAVPRWVIIPYLLIVDLQNTILSGFFTFYGRVLYPSYASAPRVTSLSAIDDQTFAGTLMWVPGSIAFLLPAAVIAIKYLTGSKLTRRLPAPKTRPRPAAPRERFDLLRVPGIGPVLRSKYFRVSLQAFFFGLALVVVLDGFFGPQVAAMNLAGVLPWIHWRGLAVLVLLVAGNFFCMACPFTFARDLGRKFFPATSHWPRPLRSKWLAIGLLVFFFWAYEFFDLWETPWWTAWIIVFYFVSAVLVDGIFKGASFCKHVCPIGQFHFVSSLVSPLEVRVRDADVCTSCRTHDCLSGNETQRGCELHLFQAAKSGNMDCTFCLDCVKACPSDNVGILTVPPGSDLLHSGKRSAVGDYSRRLDIAALVLVLTFSAFANAAGMVAPVLEFEKRSGLAASFLFTGFVLVLPALLSGACAWLSVRIATSQSTLKQVLCGMAVLFAPLGFSMWAAHFLFHFFAGALTPLPIIQRLAKEVGITSLSPDWNIASLAFPGLPALEILILNAGCLFTLWLLWKKTLDFSTSRALLRFLPWAVLACGLYAIGIWILVQPMAMRGTMIAGG